MATNKVLKEAIIKLKYNSMILTEKKNKCNNNTDAIKEIEKQLAQNDSMILDYEYRLKNNLG